MNSIGDELIQSNERKRLIMKRQDEILALGQRAKKAEEKQRRAESKIKRMTTELFSDKPMPLRFERMKKILNENEGMRIRHYAHPKRK
ncbi:hypothetical protein [Domibacillus aminovorans]|uniref:Uncharacterized protein n=1 Tax=Domibacillus aminovorans TaxID=29332 RepID=A0A177L6Q1_9BACI|nr:hypothetical protein [Domibacillus aminovorans]OAH60381.1 hypothetical protein AWH49_16780 [Domibacillus aminovorans]